MFLILLIIVLALLFGGASALRIGAEVTGTAWATAAWGSLV